MVSKINRATFQSILYSEKASNIPKIEPAKESGNVRSLKEAITELIFIINLIYQKTAVVFLPWAKITFIFNVKKCATA